MSFFSSEQYSQTPHFLQNQDISAQDFSYSWWTIQLQQASWLETLMTNIEAPRMSINENTISLDVSLPGKYLSSLRDVRKEYIFEWPWYSIAQEGIGEVYIDSETNEDKTFILALNTPVRVTLKNPEGGEVYTNIYLHPHMYLEFQASRWDFLKNADALRVKTVYTLWYLGTAVSNIETHNVGKRYSVWSEDFLQSALNKLSQRDNIYAEKLQSFLDQWVTQIWGYAMVKRYMHLFVNNQKKVIFYKNIILDQYREILQAEMYDEALVTQTLKDLQVLQDLDRDAYNELISLREDYLRLLNAQTEKEFIIPKMLFSSFEDTLWENKTSLFPLTSFALFSHFDDSWNFNREVEAQFLESFMDSQNQEMWRVERILRYQYFSFLLQGQLSSALTLWSEVFSATSFIDMLQHHIDVTTVFYDTEKNTRISMLYTYNDILQQIEEFLRWKYFLASRNEDGLLQYSPWENLSGEDVLALQGQLDRIFEMYRDNKKNLSAASSRDRAINIGILESQEKIWEYLSALNNYESYVSEYDISKKNLLNVNTFWSQQDRSLSETRFREYMNQFDEVSLERAVIEVWETWYQVKQVFIRGKNFEFTLSPESWNKLQNIRINSVASSFVYNLDLIKDQWQEQYTLAAPEEKGSYDFRKFFINTFFTNTWKIIEEFETIVAGPNEDKTEIVFKRDILLGERWEFAVIRDVLPLEYKDIAVSKDGDFYDIFIESAPLSLAWIENLDENLYQAVMDGEYVLSDENHYFEKVELRVYFGSETDIRPVFADTQIQITGRIQLTDLKNRVDEIFWDIAAYVSLYNTLDSDFFAENIVMQYSSRMKKMTFKFDLNEKDYTILASWNTIDSLYRGTKKLIEAPIVSEQLEKYLP